MIDLGERAKLRDRLEKEEVGLGFHVRRAGVGDADSDGEELEEALVGVAIGVRADRRHNGAKSGRTRDRWGVEIGRIIYGRRLPTIP